MSNHVTPLCDDRNDIAKTFNMAFKPNYFSFSVPLQLHHSTYNILLRLSVYFSVFPTKLIFHQDRSINVSIPPN